MKWQRVKFKNFIQLQRGFDLPKSFMQEGEVPVLGSNCIIGYHNETKVAPPGVVTGRSGTLGLVQYTDSPYWPHNTALWVKDFKGNRPKFVFYKLQTLNLESFNGGVSVPTLNRNVLDDLEVIIPNHEAQKQIAEILSAYDDLIENNRRRMALLEETARQLYREWFVHLRFPGHEHTQIVDGMPDGWEKKPLGGLAEVTMGQSPESKHYNETGEGLPFHQGVADFGDRFVTNRIFTTAQSRIANAGDILCSVRAPVGRLNITLDKIVIGRGLAAIRSRTGHQSFLFSQLRTHFFKEDLIGAGAIFASVTRAEFENQQMLTPPKHLIQNYEEISVPIDDHLRVLFLQKQKLKAARDLLLPRLMSGEIAL